MKIWALLILSSSILIHGADLANSDLIAPDTILEVINSGAETNATMLLKAKLRIPEKRELRPITFGYHLGFAACIAAKTESRARVLSLTERCFAQLERVLESSTATPEEKAEALYIKGYVYEQALHDSSSSAESVTLALALNPGHIGATTLKSRLGQIEPDQRIYGSHTPLVNSGYSIVNGNPRLQVMEGAGAVRTLKVEVNEPGTYRIQISEDLQNWSESWSGIVERGTFELPAPNNDTPQRFYRVLRTDVGGNPK